MAIMMGNLYAALRSANVPDDKAREEVAEFKGGLADVKSTQRLHSWILTFNTAMTIAIIGKLFLGH
jgi:hypothetical protein